MTVDELISTLRLFPNDARVFVNGYEGGFDDPEVTYPVSLDLNAIDSDVYGPHAQAGEGWNPPTERVAGVVIARHGR